MKRQPKRTFGKVAAVLLFNAATAFALIAFFAPHWLPFLNTKSTQAAIAVQKAPDNGSKTKEGATVIAGKPVRVKVPAANIDLPIADGTYDNKKATWTLSDTTAHYALVTPFANNTQGNTFVYGHNTNQVFGRLLKIAVGDKAYIETDNKKVFEYTLRSSKDVEPSDVSLFTYKGKPILTMQTCAGTWDQNRRLFTFDFITVKDMP